MAATLGQNSETINRFNAHVTTMPHFVAVQDSKLLRGMGLDISLGRPAINRNERHVIVGTDNQKGPQCLVLVDTDVLTGPIGADCTVSRESIPKPVLASQWVGNDRFLACTGTREETPSTFHLYRVNVDGDGKFEKQGELTVNDAVREIARHPVGDGKFAYGGSENKLQFVDLNAGFVLGGSIDTEFGVSSVRWTPFHHSALLSCTNEMGQLRVYDMGADSKQGPIWKYQGDLKLHRALYTHCQVSEYQMVLGYEDNYMEAIDIRMNQQGRANNLVPGTFDPFCYMIGDMHYQESTGSLLLSGMADFTVYKHYRSGADKGIAQLWSHSTSSKNRSNDDTGSVFHASFLKDNWVVGAMEAQFYIYKLE